MIKNFETKAKIYNINYIMLLKFNIKISILLFLFFIYYFKGLSQNKNEYLTNIYKIDDYSLYYKNNLDTSIIQIIYIFNEYNKQNDTMMYLKKNDETINIINATFPYRFLMQKPGSLLGDYRITLGHGIGLNSKQKRHTVSFTHVLFKESPDFNFNAFNFLSFNSCTFEKPVNHEFINCDTLYYYGNEFLSIKLNNIYGKVAYFGNNNFSSKVNNSYLTFSEALFFYNNKTSDLTIEGCILKHLMFNKCLINGKLAIISNKLKIFVFENSTCNQDVLIDNVKFPEFSEKNLSLFNPYSNDRSQIKIDKANFNENVNFINILYPEVICLYNVNLKNILKLSSIKNFGTRILIYDTDFDKLEIDFTKFNLGFDFKDPYHKIDKYSISYTYERLMERSNADLYSNAYKKLDLEHKFIKLIIFGNIFDKISYWIQKIWWNFGYSKFLILIHSLLLWIIFTLLNMINFKELLTIYDIPNISKIYKKELKVENKRFRLKIFYLVLIYTGTIFWNLKINIDRLNIKNIYKVTYIYIIYLSGIICLSFIANYIINF